MGVRLRYARSWTIGVLALICRLSFAPPLQPGPELASLPAERQARILRLKAYLEAHPEHLSTLPDVSFHWGSRNRVEGLLKGDALDATLFGNPMVRGTDYEQVLGEGVYVSRDPFDSHTYGGSKDPRFKVFHVPEKLTVAFVYGADDEALKGVVRRNEIDRELRELGYESEPATLSRANLKKGITATNSPIVSHAFKEDLAVLGIHSMQMGPTWYAFTHPHPEIQMESAEDYARRLRENPGLVPYPLDGDPLVSAFRHAGLPEAARAIDRISREKERLFLIGSRFIDREHMAAAIGQELDPRGEPLPRGTEAFDVYGREALVAFGEAVRYAEEHSSRLPTMDDIAQLHRIAYEYPDRRFHSFYMNEIRRFDRKQDRTKAAALLGKGDVEGLRNLFRERFGEAPEEPVGRLRSHEIQFSGLSATSGDHQTRTDAHRILSGEELERIRENPYIRIASITQVGEDKFKVKMMFPSPDQLEALMKEHLRVLAAGATTIRGRVASGELERGTEAFERAVAELAADFYLRVVSTHPFSDGNGRTAKLARDWVLNHFDLPAAYSTPSNDFLMKPEALASDLHGSIRDSWSWWGLGRTKPIRVFPPGSKPGSCAHAYAQAI